MGGFPFPPFPFVSVGTGGGVLTSRLSLFASHPLLLPASIDGGRIRKAPRHKKDRDSPIRFQLFSSLAYQCHCWKTGKLFIACT